jgi:hypothetical protein
MIAIKQFTSRKQLISQYDSCWLQVMDRNLNCNQYSHIWQLKFYRPVKVT